MRRLGATTRRSTKNSGLCCSSRAATQLGVLDHRAIAHARVLSALARETGLVALVQMLGKALEEGRRGRHRQLHERRLATGAHDGDQPVHRRLALMLEAVEQLDALDELGVLLQPQHRGRHAEQPAGWAHPAVRVGASAARPRPSPHPPRGQVTASHAVDERSCPPPPSSPARGVVHLERNGRLTKQQPPPPAAQQALVQRLEHRHHRLGACSIGAVDLDPQDARSADVLSPCARTSASASAGTSPSARSSIAVETPATGDQRRVARAPSRSGPSRAASAEPARANGLSVAEPRSSPSRPAARRHHAISARPANTASTPSSRHSRKRSTHLSSDPGGLARDSAPRALSGVNAGGWPARPARPAPSGATRSRRPSPGRRPCSRPASGAPAGSGALRSGPDRRYPEPSAISRLLAPGCSAITISTRTVR